MPVELTTVADDEVIFFEGVHVRRYEGLAPDTQHIIDGVVFRTLPRPSGELLSVVATVNDVHFGETECGVIEGLELGPIFRSGPGEEPYPELMSHAAVTEIDEHRPSALVAKGDLTAQGSAEEFRRFLDCYCPRFGDRLVMTRGNHDAYGGVAFADTPYCELVLPGVRLAVLDTVIPGATPGRVTPDQLEWLDELASRSDRPVLVFGHHHPWNPDANTRPPDYFGINPSDSERLVEVVSRRSSIVAYFAGHTHRNRVRRFRATVDVPWVEVACVKDFPGMWAEYRVYETGILQVGRRLTAPDALAWSERTRAMFGGLYPAYAFGDLGDRCFPIWFRSER